MTTRLWPADTKPMQPLHFEYVIDGRLVMAEILLARPAPMAYSHKPHWAPANACLNMIIITGRGQTGRCWHTETECVRRFNGSANFRENWEQAAHRYAVQEAKHHLEHPENDFDSDFAYQYFAEAERRHQAFEPAQVGQLSFTF